MKLGWHNMTTWTDEIDLTENWALFYVLKGATMRVNMTLTRTSNAPPFTEVQRRRHFDEIETRVRKLGGIF